MKKTTILTSAVLLSSLFATVAPAAHAAVDETLNTTGKITFKTTDENSGNELALVKAPNVDFGEQAINGSDKTYEADIAATEFIQVDDNRGTNVGWSLSVANTQFKTTSKSELTGAVLTIGLAAPTVENNNNVSPATDYNATAEEAVVLSGDSASQQVASAAEQKGMGINKITYAKASLKVPGTTVKEKAEYVSNLTWTLSDAPI